VHKLFGWTSITLIEYPLQYCVYHPTHFNFHFKLSASEFITTPSSIPVGLSSSAMEKKTNQLPSRGSLGEATWSRVF